MTLDEIRALVGAVLCAASPAVEGALARYGRHLGAAYQLIDDVLDYRSDPATRGKNLGEDLAEGKPTLPLIHALRNSSGEQALAIRNAITRQDGSAADLDSIIASIDRTGGIDYTRSRALAESQMAIEALDTLPNSPVREGLAALAMLAVQRDR